MSTAPGGHCAFGGGLLPAAAPAVRAANAAPTATPTNRPRRQPFTATFLPRADRHHKTRIQRNRLPETRAGERLAACSSWSGFSDRIAVARRPPSPCVGDLLRRRV